MSARKEDRWQSDSFWMEFGDFMLCVEREPGTGGSYWDWVVIRGTCIEGQGTRPDEKAAKLAARRCAERVLVKEAKAARR